MIDREPPVTEEELHAYVDGELAADRRVAVEQWLAAHLGQWLSRRVGYPLRAPDLDTTGLKLVGGRLLPSPAAGPAAAFFMYEGATGERFTVYCRRAMAPQSALRYRAAGLVGSFVW